MEHLLFVNYTCSGCKQALKVIENPRYKPHVQVIAISDSGARTLMNSMNIMSVPVLVMDPGTPDAPNPRAPRYSGAGQIMGALQRRYPSA